MSMVHAMQRADIAGGVAFGAVSAGAASKGDDRFA